MKIRRRITGALCNFLDAYASRYSDWDGYWIFGLLAREADPICFDLFPSCGDVERSATVTAAMDIARGQFAAVLSKSGIPPECIATVRFRMTRVEPWSGFVNGHICSGHRVLLKAEALSDLGKSYMAEKVIFVAPHDPRVEHRSTRRNS